MRFLPLLASLAIHVARGEGEVVLFSPPGLQVTAREFRAGFLYTAGYTHQRLPVTAGAYMTDYRPCQMPGSQVCPWGVVAKTSANGNIVALTYLAGLAGDSYISDIRVLESGDVVVAGTYNRRTTGLAGFPYTRVLAGTPDGQAFVARLDRDLARLIYAIGLSSGVVTALTVDSNGAVTLATAQATGDLPLANPLPGSPRDGSTYLLGLSNDGLTLRFATRFDGAVDALRTARNGHVFAIGTCAAIGPRCVSATPNALNRGGPHFALELDPAGRLQFAAFTGFPANDLAVDPGGRCCPGRFRQ